MSVRKVSSRGCALCYRLQFVILAAKDMCKRSKKENFNNVYKREGNILMFVCPCVVSKIRN